MSTIHSSVIAQARIPWTHHRHNWWWEFLHFMCGYVPEFLGNQEGHKGKYYTRYHNEETNVTYYRDNQHGTVWLA